MTTAAACPSIATFHPSDRVLRLRERQERRTRELGHRILSEPEDARALAEAIVGAYAATEGEATILRRARVLTDFAAACPVRVGSDDLLVGCQTFAPFGGPAWTPEDVERVRASGWAMTPTHIVHDYEGLLLRDVSGTRTMIHERAAGADGDAAINLKAFERALDAFAVYIGRHAEAAPHLGDVLEPLSTERPATFHQALQMVWFTQVFLHAENPSVAISFGRFDQYLWPFLAADLDAGRLDLQEAFDLICAFLIKCCEGEESQNLVLGGVDENGCDATNPLSLLVLAAMGHMRTVQPSLCVRFHDDAPGEFIEACCELAAEGTGQPGFMNDAAVVPALQAAGISLERARDWGVVGCYEATPQGDSYPNTVFHCMDLVRTFSDYLHSDEAREADSYTDLEAGWWRHVEAAWGQTLPHLEAAWRGIGEHAPSPFGSVAMRGCIQSALPVERGGTTHNLVGINMLGLGTLVDSLLAIEDLVFSTGTLSLGALVEALDADWPDETLRQRVMNRADRYGSDGPRSNAMARRVSERLAQMILASSVGPGVQPYPAFFAFGGDIHLLGVASPDGRRSEDVITYGVGPATSVPSTPTTVLRSASHVAHELCGCGNPLALTLSNSDLRGGGAEIIRNLVGAYFEMGGFHVHFNVTSAERLRDAKADPQAHSDLLVRVSGFSARFVTMDGRWQDALIERAENGL